MNDARADAVSRARSLLITALRFVDRGDGDVEATVVGALGAFVVLSPHLDQARTLEIVEAIRTLPDA